MTDRTTKVLLLAIAVGIWAHLGWESEWFRPSAARNERVNLLLQGRVINELQEIGTKLDVLSSIESDVSSIESDVSSIESDVSSIGIQGIR